VNLADLSVTVPAKAQAPRQPTPAGYADVGPTGCQPAAELGFSGVNVETEEGGILRQIMLVLALLATSCAQPPKPATIYWPGDRGEGIDKMVVTLQDLGYPVESVDRQAGTIIAQEINVGMKSLMGQDYRPGRLVIQFPERNEDPILVSYSDPGLPSDAAIVQLRATEVINKIAQKFAQYGGSIVQAKE